MNGCIKVREHGGKILNLIRVAENQSSFPGEALSPVFDLGK